MIALQDRMIQLQGMARILCAYVSCNKLSQQICGCEVEGTDEKAALVYYFKENGQPGNDGIFVSIHTITESINVNR